MLLSFCISALLVHFLTCLSSAFISIDSYGALKNDLTYDAAETNANAFSNAINAASIADSDRVVLVPPGSYFIDAIYVNDVHNVEVIIQGNIIVNTARELWYETSSAFYFLYCNNFKISGNGTIEGGGWSWWDFVTKTQSDTRPLALLDVRVSYMWTIEGITLIDSPQYYIYLYDVKEVIVQGVTILTNPESNGVTAYPINTEGISVIGKDVTIRNCSITTYDDAIAVKPCKNVFKYCTCASNVLIEDINVYQSIGISIGGVQPSTYHNCISGVVYRNIRMYRPFTGIFIKTYPGNQGTGEISNITYSNIYMQNVLWWPIYIGWQSFQTPETVDPRCTQYPVNTACPTSAAISVSGITLKDIVAEKSMTYYNSPGVIRCDAQNPCRDVSFDNVTVQQRWRTSSNSYTAVESAVLKHFLGETTSDYFFRYIVENVISSSSLCSNPDFKQTFPLPSSTNGAGSTVLTSSQSYVKTEATMNAAAGAVKETDTHTDTDTGVEVEVEVEVASFTRGLRTVFDAAYSGNWTDNESDKPYSAIEQLYCAADHTVAAKASHVVKIFGMIAVTIFTISVVGFLVSMVVGAVWRKVFVKTSERLQMAEDSSQHNALIMGDRSGKSSLNADDKP